MSHPSSAGGRGASGSARRVAVGVGDLAVVDGDAALTTSGLGSCVAVALVDPTTGARGLLHAMLPSADDSQSSRPSARPAKYVDSGVDALIDELGAAGASPNRLEARLVGGAEMLDLTAAVGPRNVERAERALADAGIPIVAREVGDGVGRTVRYRPNGELAVRAADGFERTL